MLRSFLRPIVLSFASSLMVFSPLVTLGATTCQDLFLQRTNMLLASPSSKAPDSIRNLGIKPDGSVRTQTEADRYFLEDRQTDPYTLASIEPLISREKGESFSWLSKFQRSRVPPFKLQTHETVFLESPYGYRDQALHPDYRLRIELPLAKLDALTDTAVNGTESNMRSSIAENHSMSKMSYLRNPFSLGVVDGSLCLVSDPLPRSVKGTPVWDPFIFSLYSVSRHFGFDIAIVADFAGSFRLAVPMHDPVSLADGYFPLKSRDLEDIGKGVDELIQTSQWDQRVHPMAGFTDSIGDLAFLAGERFDIWLMSDRAIPIPIRKPGRALPELTDLTGSSQTLLLKADLTNDSDHILSWIHGEVLEKTFDKSPLEVEAYLNGLIQRRDYLSWFKSLYHLKIRIGVDKLNTLLGSATGLSGHVFASLPVKVADWTSNKSLNIHFKKHGRREMGLIDPSQYLSAAIEFLNSSEPNQIVFLRLKSQTFIKFDSGTKELAVVDKDGKIVTYFVQDESFRNLSEMARYVGENAIEN